MNSIERSPSRHRWSAGFTPKTLSVFREGYSMARFGGDCIAGVTVAAVAIPLSMAIAKASGASPDRGLVTAIVGGFLISLLGGSRFQIGGPAGAFIVVIASIIERQGYDGLLLAMLVAGLAMILMGTLKLGTYIKYIPHPVLVGFTSGIATIIFSSQIVDLLGLTLDGREPAALLPKLSAIASALPSFNSAAIVVSGFSLLVIVTLRKIKPNWPGFLIAIGVASIAVYFLAPMGGFKVETIGTRFGGIPSALPSPRLPEWSLAKLQAVLPDALTIAFLGAIESLLSAVVADGMTGRRHRSNMELIAQGIANIGASLFGGICATGTIARTATNVRAGGTSPVSGMIHSLVLLLLILFAAPLASFIPLASLGAILALVSWNMAERHEFIAILRRSRTDAVILLATFLLTIFRDLTEGIAAGVVLSALIFMHKMTATVSVTEIEADDDIPDSAQTSDTIVYRIEGPFFFGVATEIAEIFDRIGRQPKRFVLDLSAMPFCDGTAARVVHDLITRFSQLNMEISIRDARPAVSTVLKAAGIDPVYFVDSRRNAPSAKK
jgi:sulfate permease, SulP family